MTGMTDVDVSVYSQAVLDFAGEEARCAMSPWSPSARWRTHRKAHAPCPVSIVRP